MKKSIPEGLGAQNGVMKIDNGFSSAVFCVKLKKITRALFFDPQVGAQVGAKLRSKSTSKLMEKPGIILEHLGFDFGWFLGAKMEPKRELKIRRRKT